MNTRTITFCTSIIIAFFTMATSAHAATWNFSNSPALAIPDGSNGCNNTAGAAATDILAASGPSLGIVTDVNLDLDIPHTWPGDLVVKITSPAGTQVTVVENIGNVNAPGGGNCGCGTDDFLTTLDDEAAGGSVEDACPPSGADFTPHNPLSAFIGENASGNWTLEVVDWSGLDTGTLSSWGLTIEDTPLTVVPQTIPTMSIWGMIMLASLLTLIGYRRYRAS